MKPKVFGLSILIMFVITSIFNYFQINGISLNFLIFSFIEIFLAFSIIYLGMVLCINNWNYFILKFSLVYGGVYVLLSLVHRSILDALIIGMNGFIFSFLSIGLAYILTDWQMFKARAYNFFNSLIFTSLHVCAWRRKYEK